MPPFGADEKGQAIHALTALSAASALCAAVARAGGPSRVSNVDDFRTELTKLFDELNRLAIYQKRGMARGTITDLRSDVLAEAVTALAQKPVLSVDEEEALDLPAEEEQNLFGADGLAGSTDQAPDSPSPPDEGVFEL